MLFFLRSWCHFSSSAVVLLVSMSKVKHKYASELPLSTRFPFHCQDRFFLRFKWGSENEVERSVEKVVPKGPQMDPKSRPKSIKSVFWRGLKKGPQKGTLSRTEKVIVCYYLQYFSKVRCLRKGHFGGTILGIIWETKSFCWNRDPDE